MELSVYLFVSLSVVPLPPLPPSVLLELSLLEGMRKENIIQIKFCREVPEGQYGFVSMR